MKDSQRKKEDEKRPALLPLRLGTAQQPFLTPLEDKIPLHGTWYIAQMHCYRNRNLSVPDRDDAGAPAE